MDEAYLATLAEEGGQLLTLKLFLNVLHCLWIYDYLLTFGDEIKYAWRGRRTWVFALFIANRYGPVIQIIWSSVVMYHYSSSLCEDTKWLGVFHTTLVMVLAEMTITLRIYAVTGRNKWVGSALSSLIAAQLILGVYMITSAAVNPMQQLPDIDLDPFRFCAYQSRRLEELIFSNIGVTFELLAFSIILVVARKPRRGRHPDIPSLLDTILRDATLYFLLMFFCLISADLFLMLAPASVSVLPGLASTILIPLMASRLMLSLKKAAMKEPKMRSLSIATNHISSGVNRTTRFALRAPSEFLDVPRTHAPPGFFDESVSMELISVSQPSQVDGYDNQLRLSPARSSSDEFLGTEEFIRKHSDHFKSALLTASDASHGFPALFATFGSPVPTSPK